MRVGPCAPNQCFSLVGAPCSRGIPGYSGKEAVDASPVGDMGKEQTGNWMAPKP